MNETSKEEVEKTPSWQKSENGVKRIFQALGYSVAGFKAAYKKEAAFRQLLILCLVLLPFAIFLHVTRVERVLLLGVLLLSLLVEMFNSAIEATVDRISLENHPLSKQAKDMASAAQFLSLALIAVVWGLILL